MISRHLLIRNASHKILKLNPSNKILTNRNGTLQRFKHTSSFRCISTLLSHGTWAHHPTMSGNDEFNGIADLNNNQSISTRAMTTKTNMTIAKEKATTYLNNLSPREEGKLEQNILSAISDKVIDPVLKTNIRKLGWLQSLKISSSSSAILSDEKDEMHPVTVELNLPTLMHPHLEEMKEKVRNVVSSEILASMQQKGILDDSEFSEIDAQHILEINIDAISSKPAPFVRNIEEQDDLIKKLGPGLSNVRHFLAVYSCKGGVGKSTVAVNLAYELARLGGRVGLLDVDVYGPSLPVLVKPDDPAVHPSTIGPGVVKPIEHAGVKMLSLGFVSPTSGVPGSGQNGGAAVMRGPMAGRVVTQLLKGTEWGELDVLVIDMPPGTGDVQLTLCQDLELSGAVTVTTPSKLAAADAVKGIEMFKSLGVPTLAMVENMSYFDCEGGQRHYPFGKSIVESKKTLLETDSHLNESNIFQFPISSRTNEANDAGIPLCLSRPKDASVELYTFNSLSSTVAKELLLLQHGRSSEVSDNSSVRIGGEIFDIASLHLSVDNSTNTFVVRLFTDAGATQVEIPGEKLRSWHPKLGEPMEVDTTGEDDDSNSMITHTSGNAHTSGKGCGSHDHSHEVEKGPRLFPCKIEKKGRYGYSVEFADQATIIYSMFSLARAAGGVPHK